MLLNLANFHLFSSFSTNQQHFTLSITTLCFPTLRVLMEQPGNSLLERLLISANMERIESALYRLFTSVPQGLVLAPFCSLGEVICLYGLSYYCYANNTYLLLLYLIHHYFWILACLANISFWMAALCLKLNPSKTKLLFKVILAQAQIWQTALQSLSLTACNLRVNYKRE